MPDARISLDDAMNHPWIQPHLRSEDRQVSQAGEYLANFASFDAMVERFAKRKQSGYNDINFYTPSVNLEEMFGHEKLMQVAVRFQTA
ncbi:MAG: hypothetical protein V2I33_21355 [Kangiellaceae bacterium]|jgi:hypothetical protein|nr:hypothetical protein [Kangiellaceae bacterium]